MTNEKDLTYYYFVEHTEKYGENVALAYLEYKKGNPIKENQPLQERMNYFQGFCKTYGLKHPDIFFEIENAREKKVRRELMQGAAMKVIARGSSVCLPPNLRKTIEDKLKDD